jgi:hypothetical protein
MEYDPDLTVKRKHPPVRHNSAAKQSVLFGTVATCLGPVFATCPIARAYSHTTRGDTRTWAGCCRVALCNFAAEVT